MNKNQLITIAVTAVVSVTAKELITWMASCIKSWSVVSTTKEKVKNNRAILTDLFWLVVPLIILVLEMRETAPVTRFTVLRIVGLVIAVVFWIFAISVDVIMAKIRRKRDRQSPPSAPQ